MHSHHHHHQPTSNTPRSDSSFSSSSSSEIMGTPFDLGAQRFEYPFPQSQGSPTDTFLPLSSSHAQSPPWPIHVSKSFPLTPPPLGKLKAHPKLRSANAREPPVPPGLVKRRSRIPGVQHQSSSEEPSDRSDVGDDIARAQRPPRSPSSLTMASQIVPIASCDRPTVENPAGLATSGSTDVSVSPHSQVVSASHPAQGTCPLFFTIN